MAAADWFASFTAAADGTALVQITTGTRFQTWTISQVSVEVPTAPIGSTCAIRRGGALVTPLIPTGDAATGDPPITIRPGESLDVEFAGLPPGAPGTVYAVYDDGVTR